MKRSKAFIFALIFVLPFVVSCGASHEKPKVIVDQPNNIPADIPSQFADRYKRFISGKEQKEFEKLETDEERQVFIDKFWADRDPNPLTSENEYKQKIDDRIDDIASERFFGGSSVAGLLFRSNGGFQGDMAKVYLLHGDPDAMDVIEGGSFVPMMLWIYTNPENGSIMYAFLFYQKYNSGSYILFDQDLYQMDRCGAIYQVATVRMYNYNYNGGSNCSEDLYEVYNNIYRATGRVGILDGNVFAWALFNFSNDSSLKQAVTLDPPKSASETAKQSGARVIGEAPKLTGTAGTDYILASCDKCNSMMPAELNLGKEFVLSFKKGDIEWQGIAGLFNVELKIRTVLENTVTNTQLVFDGIWAPYLDDVEDVSGSVILTIVRADEVAQIPAGTYRISVYVKNMMTKKYNSWSKDVVIK